MLKKNVIYFLLLSLIIVLSGCSGGTASTPAPTNTGVVNSTSEGSEEKYTLRLVHGYTPVSIHNENMEWFNEELQKRSNGQLNLEIFGSAQLMPIDQEIPNILSGQVDMSYSINSIMASLDPIWNLYELPFLFNFNPEDMNTAMKHQLDFIRSENGGGKIAEVMEEKGLKVIAFGITDAYAGLWTRNAKDLIKVPEDAKGLKIRMIGGSVTPEALSAIGANGIAISGAELSTALQQGLVDGALLATLYTYDNKLPLETYTNVPMVNYSMPVIMSLDKFNSLPEHLQKILLETGQAFEEYAQNVVIERNNNVLDKIESEMGVEIYNPSEEELGLWRESFKSVHDKFINDNPSIKPLIDEINRLAE